MCGRYVIATKVKVIEKKFNLPPLKVDLDLFNQHVPNYNLSPGELAPVITNQNRNRIQFYRFGYSNPRIPKPPFVINARSEGAKNKENDVNYRGGPGIINSFFWKDAILKRRCIIIADAFYEGPTKEKLKKPHLCYLLDKNRPFVFAGIWCEIPDKTTGASIGTFAILTHVANSLMSKIQHHRSPVILESDEIHTWLNSESELSDVSALLKPYPGHLMNAYPVDPLAIKLGKEKRTDKDVIQPIGQRIFTELEDQTDTELELIGMGRRRRKDYKDISSERKTHSQLDLFSRSDEPDLLDLL